MVKTEITSNYTALFEENLANLRASNGEVVNEARAAALAKFEELGIPNLKNEDFLYTNLQRAFEDEVTFLFEKDVTAVDTHEVFKCDVPNLDTHTVFFVNGWHYATDIVGDELPDGVILDSFAKASVKYPELFAKYYNKQAGDSIDGTVQLNTAMAQDGLFLYVPKNVVLEKPIQVINVLNSDMNLFAQQRGLFIIEENAQAKVLVCDHTLTSHTYKSNHVREIFAGKNAVMDYYLMENQHNRVSQIISTFIHQEATSNVLSNIITLHNGLTRNNTYVTLAGEGAESHLYGMALCDKDQHVDNFSFIDHAVPNCTSTELFKYVLDDKSTGVFRGKIMVQEGAKKTLAYQTNNNICLSNDSKMYVKPQLEIYNDDVKCSHGATTGQLDEKALFYLRSRGISDKEARLLLMYAFTFEIADNIRLEPLKERIHELIEKRFRGELSKCVGCAICN